MSPRPLLALAAAVTTAALVLAGTGTPADAGQTVPSLPRTDPVDTTPRVVDDETVPNAGVRELRQVGRSMYAGGEFRTVTDAAGTTTYRRANIFMFNADTGAVRTVPRLRANGAVYTIEPTANGRYLFIGGEFTRFGGRVANSVVKFDRTTNRVVGRFRFPVANDRVTDLQLVRGRLFVAGTFRGGIVAVHPGTGARLRYLDRVQVAGQKGGYRTRVHRFAVNPAATRMVVIGSFTSVGGRPRQQAAVVRLGPRTATLSPWTSETWNRDCARRVRWYTRDVDWAPNGRYFVIATSGGGFADTFCDTVTRWEPVDAAGRQPTWIQHSGGDTFHSVVVTDKAVFVGGHFRWLDNPDGRDTMGPGAAEIRGLGALDHRTGRAIRTWNPTKSIEGGHGAYDLYFTARGLWVAHFEHTLGHERHEGLGLLPF